MLVYPELIHKSYGIFVGMSFEYLEKCLDTLIEYGKTGRILIEYFRNTSSQAGPKTSDSFRILGACRSVF